MVLYQFIPFTCTSTGLTDFFIQPMLSSIQLRIGAVKLSVSDTVRQPTCATAEVQDSYPLSSFAPPATFLRSNLLTKAVVSCINWRRRCHCSALDEQQLKMQGGNYAKVFDRLFLWFCQYG